MKTNLSTAGDDGPFLPGPHDRFGLRNWLNRLEGFRAVTDLPELRALGSGSLLMAATRNTGPSLLSVAVL